MSGYDTYGRLTEAEKSFVWRHPFVAMGFNDDANSALAEARRRYPAATLHNGTGDAFRHAYWNALMTKREGEALANEFATAHESTPGQPANERTMDLHNNAVGRRIAMDNPGASDGLLAHLVAEALSNGRLVTLR